jgi:signal recognition particle receptor subunit alpha
VNALVRETFIEGKRTEDGLEKDGYSVRWTMENGLGLIFVVVFPALLPLAYVPTLLAKIKQLFLAMFEPLVRSLVNSLADTQHASTALGLLHERIQVERWDAIFDRTLRECEGRGVNLEKQPSIAAASDTLGASPDTSVTAEEIAKNVQHLKARLRRAKGKTPSPSPSKSASKLMRKWGDSPINQDDMAALDYSAPADNAGPVSLNSLVSNDALGTRTFNGSYEVADWDSRGLPTEEEILARKSTSETPVDMSRLSSMLSRLAGKKTLSREDLLPVLQDMEKHLMAKNVAKDIAEKMCEAVGTALVGKKLGGLTSKCV